MQRILVNFMYKHRGEIKHDWAYINTEMKKFYPHAGLLEKLRRNLKRVESKKDWQVIQINYMFRPCQ